MSNGRYDHGGTASEHDGAHGGGYGSPGKSTLTSVIQRKAAAVPILAPAASPESDGAAADGNGLSCEQSYIDSIIQGPVQRDGDGAAPEGADVHGLAAAGIAGSGGSLPFLDQIQHSFGNHDVSGVAAHTDGAAAAAASGMGAAAYATGNHVAFGGAPDLHTAAHEAAHVVQQRAGVHLKGGVGEEGDHYERHADAVADRVVRGESAEELLGETGGGGEAEVAEEEAEGGELAGAPLQMRGVRPFYPGGKKPAGKGDAMPLHSNDPDHGLRLHNYPKDGVEPAGWQPEAIKRLAGGFNKRPPSEGKMRIVIEGHSSGDEDPGRSKERALAVAAALKAAKVDDKLIIDAGGLGAREPVVQEVKGKTVDEKARALNRRVIVRVETSLDFLGPAHKDDDDADVTGVTGGMPGKGGTMGDDLDKADAAKSAIMTIDFLVGETILLGAINTVVEPMIIWLKFLDAMDELYKAKGRHAYADGARAAAGYSRQQMANGATKVDYAGMESKVTAIRASKEYTPLDPRDAQAAYSAGVIAVTGGSWMGGKNDDIKISHTGAWNEFMHQVERKADIAVSKHLREQRRDQKEAPGIYNKLILDVRKAAADRMVDAIGDAVRKKS